MVRLLSVLRAQPLGPLVVLSLALALLTACKRKPEGNVAAPQDPPEQSNERALPGGELVFAFDGAAVSQFVLDPHKSVYAPHHRLMRSIFDSLVVALPGHRFGPWLAERWQISPDGREYTFELRKDVLFHDGTRFDARAVKFNFDRIHEAKNALLARDDLGPYSGSDVLDDFKIKVRFEQPLRVDVNGFPILHDAWIRRDS